MVQKRTKGRGGTPTETTREEKRGRYEWNDLHMPERGLQQDQWVDREN